MYTEEQDAFILMAHFRSGTRNPDGTWVYCLRSCFEQFIQQFPDVNIDYETFGHHKRSIVKRFEARHCICKGKSSGRRTLLTEPVIQYVQACIDQNPSTSLRRLAAQTGLSVSSCSKAIKKVKAASNTE